MILSVTKHTKRQTMLKKIFIVTVLVVLTAGYAQAQFKFGVRAGFNLTNFYGSDSKMDAQVTPKMKPGFQAGVVGEYSFSESFALQPAVIFATQGAKYKINTAGTLPGMEDVDGTPYFEYKGDEKFQINYIQIPINAQYKYDLGPVKLLLQAGPYFGFGIGGKYTKNIDYTISGEGGKINDDKKIKFGNKDNDDDTYYFNNAFDLGLGIGAGVQFAGFQAGLGYNFGFMSLTDDGTVKNNGLTVTLTYLFGK